MHIVDQPLTLEVVMCTHYFLRFFFFSLTQHSTEAAVEESERVFSRLIRSIEKERSEVKELLRFQERAAVTQAEELLEKIQREVVEVRRADAELENLSGTHDHIHFLQVHARNTKCRMTFNDLKISHSFTCSRLHEELEL